MTVTYSETISAPALREQQRRNAYRAMFTFDAGAESLDRVLEQAAAWLRSKGVDVDLRECAARVFPDGSTDAPELSVVHRDDARGHQFRIRHAESNAAGRWYTELVGMVPARFPGLGWVCVNVTNSHGRAPQPPGLVGRLLDVLDSPRDGDMLLSSQAPVLRVDDLDDLLDAICDPHRQGLLFVAGSAPDPMVDAWIQRVRKLTGGMRGIAQPVVLDPPATLELAQMLGADHAVAPWTIRTFRPGTDPAWAADARRHRVLSTERISADPDPTIRNLLARVARQHANAQPSPAFVSRAMRDLDRVSDALLLNSLFSEPTPANPESRARHLPETSRGPAPADAPPPAAPAVNEAVDTGADALTTPPPPPPAPRFAPEDARVDDAPGSRADDKTAESDKTPPLVAIAAPELEQLHRDLAAAQARARLVEDYFGADVDEDTLVALLEKATSPTPAAGDAAQAEQTAAMLAGAKEQLREHQRLVGDLEEALTERERALAEESDERLLAEWERARVADENLWLRAQLRELAAYDAAAAPVPASHITEFPNDFDELVDWLPRLAERGVHFTGDANEARKLTAIDATGKYAMAAWETLLVIADYRAARVAGDHDTNMELYLRNTPTGYRAMSPKRHAGGETGTTMGQYGHLRSFPVPGAVDPSGSAVMAAHFKLARHGMVSPRLHYYDDVAGTGAVYVGYIGEHLRCVSTN